LLINKQRTLAYVEDEWGTYLERFNRLPVDEQAERVKQQGYEQFRDILAHVLAWWDEGMEVIHALAEGREFERRKYDFDAFNAEAVAKYRSWDEAEFLSQFEETRQKMGADLRINHAHEHLVVLSRFLVVDMLENEWGTYIADFNQLEAEKQNEFLSKQGFENFHDLLAHIIGWWEEGARIITGIVNNPGFTWESHDTDAFNVELTEKYSTWTDDDLFKHYEAVRLALMDLTANLPDDFFLNKDIEGWLRDDVVEHYNEHAVSA